MSTTDPPLSQLPVVNSGPQPVSSTAEGKQQPLHSFDQPRFSVSNTALEILNGYTSAKAELKPALSQVESSESTSPAEVRQSTGRHLLYRYEMNGIVVYDSHARCCEDSQTRGLESRVPQTVPLAVRRELEGAPEYDRMMYLNMPQYPKAKTMPEEYTLVTPLEGTLRFDSKFESGNLRKAIKVADDEYTLLQDYDVDTKGHTQWFYFSVRNERPGHRVHFSIVNLMKYDSLYNNGMKPLVLSTKKQKREGVSWYRAGDLVTYYQNTIPRNTAGDSKLPQFYYTLSFVYTFEYERDLVYFAHCYPYTYSGLLEYLDECALKEGSEEILRVDTLCSTLAGNQCPILTITSNVKTYTPWNEEYSLMLKSAAGRKMIRQREERKEQHMKIVEQIRNIKLTTDTGHRHKKGVILSARVHPGETNSSYMMQGAIDFLLSNSKEARLLRNHYVFKVVPMLNPDGVVYGNYRCSLLGVDLNRRWKTPNRHLHPTVYYAKKLFQMFCEVHPVVMYCDMHGHSMKKNVFMYACGRKGPDLEIAHKNILSKMVPMMLSQSNKIFSLRDTKFRLERSKESTARIVIYKEMGVVNSYTLEASFYGPSHIAALQNRVAEPGESNGDSHLQPEHLKGLGRDLCKVCLYFVCPAVFRRKLEEVSRVLREAPTAPSFLERRKKQKPQTPPPTGPNRKDASVTETLPAANESLPTDDSSPMEDPACAAFAITDAMLSELQSYEAPEDEDQDYMADVLKAISDNPELSVLAQPDEESDSGGSDSLGSDNDDQKLEVVGKLIDASDAKQRSKTAGKKKQKAIQRSDSASKQKQQPARRPPKPASFSPAKLSVEALYERKRARDAYLFQTIQQHLETLSARNVHSVKCKDELSPRLKKGRSSQSFSAEDSFQPLRSKELQEILDSEPRVRVAKAAGGYQNFSIPTRPEVSFSPSSSFIITSMQHPRDAPVLNSKLSAMRKPSFSMYRKTQRPSRIAPLPRTSDLCQRGRAVVYHDSSRLVEVAPFNSTLSRELEAAISRSGLDSRR